ncbi:MAG: alpha/beta fold hydrolase [Vicinamibacterales bacterium]
MERLTASNGTVISYDKDGSGPPLVLVHGGFSDHRTNWAFIQPTLRDRFTTYAIARRGRGETDATVGHTIQDEANDVAALIRTIGRPVFLLAPVLLQIGSQSPRHFYVTDAMAAVLPDARIEVLPGQAHEGMTTAPQLYVEAISNFLC